MTFSQNSLLWSILLFGAILASVNSTGTQNLRGNGNDESISVSLPASRPLDAMSPLSPFSRVYNRLQELEWDPVRIDSTVREYWQTDKNFLRYIENDQGENVTIISTSCHHTAPWIIVALLQLQLRPYAPHSVYDVPENQDLVVYSNVEYPHSTLPTPSIQNIRDFINSRPSNESVFLQIDMCQEDYCRNDHHFMIHAYNGQISLYQSWQDHFTLIDWMTDSGSFESKYPMAQETFLDHFEAILGPAVEEDEIRRKQESVWAILGRTSTLTWKPRHIDDKERVDDVVVRLLHDTWLVLLVTHWPNQS